MKRSWIKLYLEILDDPKMGRLPDWLWRRAVELFLLAGENGNDGLLQPVMDMAWRLRTSPEKLTESLQALSQVGVVHETVPGQWVVTHFAKRQAALSDAERAARYRDSHEPVTNRDADRHETKVTPSSSSSVESMSLPDDSDPPEEEQRNGTVTNRDAIRDESLTDTPQYQALTAAGVREPKLSTLAVLPWVTAEYVQAHVELAKRQGHALGTAISRIENHWLFEDGAEQGSGAFSARVASSPLAEYFNGGE